MRMLAGAYVAAGFLLATLIVGCAHGSDIPTGPVDSGASSLHSASSHDGGSRRRRASTTAGAAGAWPGADYQPFSQRSAFNQAGPFVPDPESAAIVANIMSGQGGLNNAAVGVAADGLPAPALPATPLPTANPDYGYPYYYASASAPQYTIHCINPWGRCPIEGATVRIPTGAMPETGSDGHMAVLDVANNVEYDFFASSVPNPSSSTLNVGWGGSGPIFDSGTVTATGYGSTSANPEPFQATHGDVALTLGTIRPADLAAAGGVIPHALQIAIPCALGTGVAPLDYVTADTTCKPAAPPFLNPAFPPKYGMRLYLDATAVELSKLGLNKFQLSLWTAMATYGAIVTDTTGNSSINFQTEDPRTYTTQGGPNPWAAVAAQNGVPAVNAGQGFKYYFNLAPNATAAEFIASRLEIAEPGVSPPSTGSQYGPTRL